MRPKIQEGETYRADGGTRGCLGRGNVGRRRNASQGYDPDALPLPLVIKEKERFILHDGSAKRTAELVVMKRSFWSRRHVKKVPSVKRVVAEILEPGAMKLVRSTLCHDVDHRAAVSSVLCLEVRKYAHLANSVDWQNCRRRGEHATLVDSWVITVAVVHVRAVEQIIVGPSARPVHRKFSERSRRIRNLVRRAGHAWIQIDQLRIITPVDWQISDALLRQRAAERGVRYLDQRKRLARNCYLFLHLAGFQRSVHVALGRDVHLYAARDRGLKAGLLDRYIVGSDWQLGNTVAPIPLRFCFAKEACIHVVNGHRCAGHCTPCRVRDCSKNRATKGLRYAWRVGQHHQRDEHQCPTQIPAATISHSSPLEVSGISDLDHSLAHRNASPALDTTNLQPEQALGRSRDSDGSFLPV